MVEEGVRQTDGSKPEVASGRSTGEGSHFSSDGGRNMLPSRRYPRSSEGGERQVASTGDSCMSGERVGYK